MSSKNTCKTTFIRKKASTANLATLYKNDGESMEKHDYQDAFLPIEVGERFEFQCENCGNSVECTRESMDMYEDKVCESCGSIITIYYNDEENNQEMI